MKRIIKLILVPLFGLLLTSCVTEQSLDTKIIEKEDLYYLIIEDGELIPGEGLSWYMDKNDFLNSEYSSGKLDPESSEFEEHRISNSENGPTGISPDIEVKLKKYDAPIYTICLFDEKDQLIKVCYRLYYPSDSVDDYANLLNDLCRTADSFDELLASTPAFENFASTAILESPISIKWHHISQSAYFQINSVNFQNYLIIDLILSVDD